MELVMNRTATATRLRLAAAGLERKAKAIQFAWQLVASKNTRTEVRGGPPIREVQPMLCDPTWTRIIVLRDPLDRFLSAWRSKCVEVESGPWDCFWLPNRGTAVPLKAIINTMNSSGDHGNIHWAPQVQMCGGLQHTLRLYQHVIPFAAAGSVLPSIVAAHDPEPTSAPAFYKALARPDPADRHVTSRIAGGRISSATPTQGDIQEAAHFVRRYYAADYQLISMLPDPGLFKKVGIASGSKHREGST